LVQVGLAFSWCFYFQSSVENRLDWLLCHGRRPPRMGKSYIQCDVFERNVPRKSNQAGIVSQVAEHRLELQIARRKVKYQNAVAG
jgi:hypothetical protein